MFQSFFNALGATMNAAQAGAHANEFRETFQVFPDQKLEDCDKILLSNSCLYKLATRNIQYPMQFELSNPRQPHLPTIHCGVMEFTAEEGIAYLPPWMKKALAIEDAGLITVRNVKLPSAAAAVLQPHSSAFTKLANPRAILERTLSKFSALTVGESIPVYYKELDRIYWLEVVSLKAVGGQSVHATNIVETDMSVEFKAAKDYVEPSSQSSSASASSTNAAAAALSASAFGATSEFDIPVDHQIKVELPPASSPLRPSSASPSLVKSKSSNSSDYFSKLGSGNRLNNKSSSPSPSPSFGPASSSSPVTPLSRPQSALPSSSSSSSLSSPSFTRSASTGSPVSDVASVSSTGNRVVSEVENGFRYIYEVNQSGQRRLLRREKATSSSLLSATKGYSLSS